MFMKPGYLSLQGFPTSFYDPNKTCGNEPTFAIQVVIQWI